jgi:hypothetical protein
MIEAQYDNSVEANNPNYLRVINGVAVVLELDGCVEGVHEASRKTGKCPEGH